MKRTKFLIALLTLIAISQLSFGQGQSQMFKMEGENPKTIEWNQTYEAEAEISPFGKNVNRIYGLDVNATIQVLNPDDYLVRLILTDESLKEHVIYESYDLTEPDVFISLGDICEETCILNGIRPNNIQIEIENAVLEIKSFSYTTGLKAGWDIEKVWKEKKMARDEEKISRINDNLKARGLHWVAGPTGVSEMSYSERKKLYGQSIFPAGFEFYSGGVFSTGGNESESSLKSATATSPYVEDWDWRNRHGKNWITSIKNQNVCGSCWAFSAAGATEAMVNLSLNQQLNLDLSEQDLVSCADAGNCGGGYPIYAIDYIVNKGIVDEATFPYTATVQPCESKGTNPTELIRFSGKEPFGFGSENYLSYTEDNLKKMLIEMGPVTSGLSDWAHAMTLVGYKVVKEGDVFYYRDLALQRYWKTVVAGDPLIGKTVWIFKNSWGPYFGDAGYIYVETPINNIRYTYALKTPVISLKNNYEVICEDKDGDGYFWWGLGPKPATCNCPDTPDGNDADPTLGPLDQYGNCTILGGMPTINFSASKTIITKGETVTFNDLSTNNPTSWAWSFAGGTPSASTLQNPAVTYNTAGTYKVVLMATNSVGSNTKTVENYIQVNEPAPAPVANFSASKTVITKGETVTFSDLSTNSPTSWAWSFAGGTPSTSTLKTPAVTYNTAGTFQVALTATNSTSSNTKTVENYIQVNEPLVSLVAEFVAVKTAVEIGEQVQFNDLSQNEPTQWEWSFPGGIPAVSTEKNPKVTYNAKGEYDVTLTVSKPGTTSAKKVKLKYIVTFENTPAVYCSPAAISSSPDFISSVLIVNALNYTSPSGSGYSMAGNLVNLAPGKSYSVTLTPKVSTNRNFWKIWIDFNNDYDFNDAGETVVTVSNKKGAAKTSFTVPPSATGTARMRIAMRNLVAPGECDDNYKGEVKDFNVTFGAAASPEMIESQEIVASTENESAVNTESPEIVASAGNESPEGTEPPETIVTSIDETPEITVTTIDESTEIAETPEITVTSDSESTEMIATAVENVDIGISNSFKFYPNPVNQLLNVELGSAQPDDSYTVYNINGRKVVSNKITSTLTTVDLGGYAPGIYLLRVVNGENVFNERIIKR